MILIYISLKLGKYLLMQTKVSSHVKPRLVSGVGDTITHTRRCISSKRVSKGSEETPSKTVYNYRMRSEAEKKSTGATAEHKYPKQKMLKNEVGFTFVKAVC